MSWAGACPYITKEEPVPGGYNIMDGLREWRQAAAYVKGDRANAANGGVDVLMLGTSIFDGSGATFGPVDKIGNVLRQLLQERLNPRDIYLNGGGGYGFCPIQSGNTVNTNNWASFGGGNRLSGAATLWPMYGNPPSFTDETGDSNSICLSHWRGTFSANPNQTAIWIWPKTIRINHLRQVSTANMELTQKQAQIVYRKFPGDGTFQWVWGAFSGTTPPYVGFPPVSGTPAALDANSYYETGISCNAAESCGNRSALGDRVVKTTATDYIQIDPTAGSVDIEGVILYCDDYKMGVRFHDLTRGGINSGDYNNAVVLAGLATFGSRGGAIPGQNSQNAKLVIIELGTNDNGNGASPGVDIPTYLSNMGTLIASIQTWASKPSILLCYPPCTTGTNMQARWGDYIAAGRTLAQRYNVALLDHWALTGNSAHGGNGAGGYMFDRGFYQDGVHYTKLAQNWMAHSIFGTLMVGIGG